MFTNTAPAATMTGEIFVFSSWGARTKTVEMAAAGCKSIKAYQLFTFSNLNVNNTDTGE